MAATKTRASARSATKSKRKPTKARKPSSPKSRRSSTSAANGAARGGSARKAVEGTVKQASSSASEAKRSVGRAARKARTPLLAAGAAVAGAAGGLALGRQTRKSRALNRPKVRVNSHDLAKAARDVGEFGVHVGQLASELRKNREEANGAKRRSPVEVVLQGLTGTGRG